MKEFDRIKELTIDELIWIIFIILSLLNIFGDELEKKICYYHNKQDKNISKKIFTFTVFISFLIYSYIFYQRYQTFEKNKNNINKKNICQTRLFGSILVLIASALFLSCQLTDKEDENPNIL